MRNLSNCEVRPKSERNRPQFLIKTPSHMKYARQCTQCECGMNDGYVVGGGEEYYCSQNCLNQVYTDAEWHDMVYSGDTDSEGELIPDTDSYWTEWEEDFQYEMVDGKLIEIN